MLPPLLDAASPKIKTFQSTPLPNVGNRVARANYLSSQSYAVLRFGDPRGSLVSFAEPGTILFRRAATITFNLERVHEPIRVYFLTASPTFELGMLRTL